MSFGSFHTEAEVENARNVERGADHALGDRQGLRVYELIPSDGARLLVQSNDVSVHQSDVQEPAAEAQSPGSCRCQPRYHLLPAARTAGARFSLANPNSFSAS